MDIVIKKVGEAAEHVNQELGLENMQKLVGGYIERVALPHKIDLWLNEEGKLIDLPLNVALVKHGQLLDVVQGDVFFTSYDDEGNTIGLNDFQLNWIWANLAEGGHVTNSEKGVYKIGILNLPPKG